MDKVLERIVKCIGPRHGAKKELAEYLNIHPNVITNWLNGRNKSYRKYLPQIAYYYNTSVDYLQFGNERKEESTADSSELNERDKKDIAKSLEVIMSDLENSGDLMFDGDPASPEAIESIRNAMAMALEYAKKVNKQKYTPKKYRK